MLVIMVMAVTMVVAVVMPVFVGMAADFHIAATETASAFFAHKIVEYCSSGRESAPFFLQSQSRLMSAATVDRFN